MPSVFWRSLCSLISHTFTNSPSCSFIISSFPDSRGSLSACLLCLLLLGCGWRGNIFPLLKGDPASSQPGPPCPEAEGDAEIPRKSPRLVLCITFGTCPRTASCSGNHWEKPENQDKPRSGRENQNKPSLGREKQNKSSSGWENQDKSSSGRGNQNKPISGRGN